MKAPLELIEQRVKYYEFIVKSLLKAVGVDITKLEFFKGSSYQKSEKYTMDRFKLEGMTRISVAQKAGAEVVKQTADPFLGGLTYPLMQALDEEYLDVDAQLGGLDQRKIFTFALENLPKIGYKVRAHLMHSMVAGLGEAQKMSSSEPDSKIDLLDTPEVVAKKLKKAVCVPKKIEGNGVVAFVEHVIFRVVSIKTGGKPHFTVTRRDEEPLIYDDIEKLKADYEADIVSTLSFQRTFDSLPRVFTNYHLAHSPATKICFDECAERTPGTHSQRLRSIRGMAEDRRTSLPV